MTTPKKITKKPSANQAITPNFLWYKESNNNNTNSKENSSKTKGLRRLRKRKIIWLNPPYNRSVVTNVSKIFLKLLDKHFPKIKQLHEIFNRNSVKVSRSCTGNISQIISSQNENIFQPNKNQEPPCNCRQKENCAMQGKCRRKNVLYKCTASTPTKPERVYIGISEDEWKKRYQNHTKSFPNKRYKNETSLSSYIWKIKKETSQIPTLTLPIVKTVPAYSNTTKKCRLCLH